jgi:hypothetical protein
MAKPPRVFGLDAFGLSLPALTRLGSRKVRFSVQLAGKTVNQLWHHAPKRRDELLRQALAQQLVRLRRDFEGIEFISRGKNRASWTIDTCMPARLVGKVAAKPYVKEVTLDTIEGRRRKRVRPTLGWFCVWGVVAIQIEGQSDGFLDLEDRLVIVKAWSAEDAQHRLESSWRSYAEPYMNREGALVRWQLVSVQDVYGLFDDVISPRGTEVYSRLRKARLRPEHHWSPRSQDAPAPIRRRGGR